MYSLLSFFLRSNINNACSNQAAQGGYVFYNVKRALYSTPYEEES